MRKIISMIVLLLASFSVEAACALVTTNLVFGNYVNGSSIALDATTNMTVSCDGIAGQVITYTITINSGNSGLFTQRKLTNGANSIDYNIYLDPARTLIWGDGNAGTSILTDSYISITGMNSRNYPVYGRITGNQVIPSGNYSDSLVVTLNY